MAPQLGSEANSKKLKHYCFSHATFTKKGGKKKKEQKEERKYVVLHGF